MLQGVRQQEIILAVLHFKVIMTKCTICKIRVKKTEKSINGRCSFCHLNIVKEAKAEADKYGNEYLDAKYKTASFLPLPFVEIDKTFFKKTEQQLVTYETSIAKILIENPVKGLAISAPVLGGTTTFIWDSVTVDPFVVNCNICGKLIDITIHPALANNKKCLNCALLLLDKKQWMFTVKAEDLINLDKECFVENCSNESFYLRVEQFYASAGIKCKRHIRVCSQHSWAAMNSSMLPTIREPFEEIEPSSPNVTEFSRQVEHE